MPADRDSSAACAQEPIPMDEWIWCGYAGHFIAADSCRFHLHTRVGDYRISSVGDYRPDHRGGEMDMIGSQRYFETFVFRVYGFGVHGEGEMEPSEIDSRCYGKDAAETGDVERGHFELCRKYARVAVGLEREGWADDDE